jgi:phosphoribosylformimino-5-aminoimidazole carboxamide ribonucleotide (ProFAR) isomerase
MFNNSSGYSGQIYTGLSVATHLSDYCADTGMLMSPNYSTVVLEIHTYTVLITVITSGPVKNVTAIKLLKNMKGVVSALSSHDSVSDANRSEIKYR